MDYGKFRRSTLRGRERISEGMLMSAFAFKTSIHSWHGHGIGTVTQFAAWNGSAGGFSCLQMALVTALE